MNSWTGRRSSWASVESEYTRIDLEPLDKRASRDDVLQAVLLGQGVGRFADLSVWSFVRDGLLQPVLVDWESSDSPPFSALIRPEAKRDVAIQDFVSFLSQLLIPVEATLEHGGVEWLL